MLSQKTLASCDINIRAKVARQARDPRELGPPDCPCLAEHCMASIAPLVEHRKTGLATSAGHTRRVYDRVKLSGCLARRGRRRCGSRKPLSAACASLRRACSSAYHRLMSLHHVVDMCLRGGWMWGPILSTKTNCRPHLFKKLL